MSSEKKPGENGFWRDILVVVIIAVVVTVVMFLLQISGCLPEVAVE